MFISRFTIAAAATLALSANAYAANSIQLGTSRGEISVSVIMDASLNVTKRLVDALINTPSVKEVNNMYVEPKTIYQGPGFQLNLKDFEAPKGHISVTFHIPAANDATAVTSGGVFARLTSKGGVTGALHKALLESSSKHVITKKNPGILRPNEGDANVLENDGFGSGSVSCSYGFDFPDVSTCEFNLVK